jgi:hypothetical protein
MLVMARVAMNNKLWIQVSEYTSVTERGYVQFETSETRCCGHTISVCHDIGGGIALWQEVEIALLVAISIVIVGARVGIVGDNLVCCDLRSKEREGDDPKYDGEDIEA